MKASSQGISRGSGCYSATSALPFVRAGSRLCFLSAVARFVLCLTMPQWLGSREAGALAATGLGFEQTDMDRDGFLTLQDLETAEAAARKAR